MKLASACGFCHSTVHMDRRLCPTCGHEAHVARALCRCERCASRPASLEDLARASGGVDALVADLRAELQGVRHA